MAENTGITTKWEILLRGKDKNYAPFGVHFKFHRYKNNEDLQAYLRKELRFFATNSENA